MYITSFICDLIWIIEFLDVKTIDEDGKSDEDCDNFIDPMGH